VAEQGASRDRIGDAIHLAEIGDGFGDWVERHAVNLVAIAAALLVGSGGYALFSHLRTASRENAAAEIASIRRDYATAMGASPNDIEMPELANRDLAKQIALDHAQRFRAAAEDHAGSPVAAIAWLEAGELFARGGDAEASLDAFRSGAASADPAIAGPLQMRFAQALENAGNFAEAAAAYERAASIEDFPLRAFALADAARCQEQAGNPERALALYELAEGAPTAASLPESARARLRELRAQRAASPPPAAL
jgi:tetratricopeptide (TPR) repeat protein